MADLPTTHPVTFSQPKEVFLDHSLRVRKTSSLDKAEATEPSAKE